MNDSVSGSLLQRLRERGVVRVAASYAVIAWLLLQIADVTFEPLGVPRWAMVALIVTAFLGLPVVVALAWFYEVGDTGVRRDTAPDGTARPTVTGLRRNADIGIILVLLAVIGVLLVRQPGIEPSGHETPTIAVLPFANIDRTEQGEVLALGLAESILHQLAGLSEIDVIARASSFALQDTKADAVEIGKRLDARYLLGGTMQRAGDRLRVVAYLMDAKSGGQVWSIRFDRPTGDIFAVQDEIAVQVTQALELSIGPKAMERMTTQGTANLAAYLAYLQGRKLLANARVVDAREAIEHFGRCLKLDPGFAAAYVSMAEADLFVAEYDVTGDRRDRFEQAWGHGQQLIAKALEIDPGNGEAFLHRAYLMAFIDLVRAEKDYRRGLELSPNSAKGHAGLAAVVYETSERRDEALELLDRARKLDPFEPGHDVTKALFLLMARGALEESNALLVDVVKRHPKYPPALARLAELRYLMGEAASSILYGEQALELDPAQEMIRRNLVSAYVDLGERAAAEQLLDEDELPKSPRRLKLLMHERAWREAGEIAYETMSRGGLLSDIEAAMHVAAIRMHARTTGDFARGISALERASAVTWDATGNAVLPIEGSPMRDAAIGLADVLIASGQETRGRFLLTTIIARMRHERDELAVPEFWYYRWHPTALALNGEHDAALAMMQRAVASGLGPGDWWYYYESEPAYAALRRDPGFQATLETVRTRVEAQRDDLERMRRDRLVPDRG